MEFGRRLVWAIWMTIMIWIIGFLGQKTHHTQHRGIRQGPWWHRLLGIDPSRQSPSFAYLLVQLGSFTYLFLSIVVILLVPNWFGLLNLITLGIFIGFGVIAALIGKKKQ
ncbi:MAG: hypothetical protein H6667_03485 [Ardenticatenaceae bacterium]|nr:hypothetical protein [Ardenticatenaceae bacterium]MCB9443071.1 hypothetical protein [Ardenticatenaceae bacterium]